MAKPRVVPSFAPEEDVTALAEAKLASSGLTREDAEKLGITWLTCEEVKTLNQAHWYLPALYIPYFDPLTGKMMTPRPNWPDFYRLRALREPVPQDDKFHKYTQPPGSGMCAYFPRNVNWELILSDPAMPLIITEGELKSAKASLEGFPTIGLGGVDSWRSMRQGMPFLPDLERIVWPKRQTFVIYDSDSRTNPSVCKALWALAEALEARGALPMTTILSAEGSEEKVGLDDFLVKHGKEVFQAQLLEADHLTLARSLWALNDKYAYVVQNSSVVRQKTGALLKPDTLGAHVETSDYMENYLMPNGVLSRRKVNAGTAWVGWGLRTTVEKMVYAPGKDPLSVVVQEDGEKVYNVWPGWACQPKKGDVKLWLKLMDHLFTGAEPGAKKWLAQWLSYPLQSPGAKLLTSVMVWSRHQGNGKTLLGESMRYIYGENFSSISQEAFSGAFNGWAIKKQFVCGDDISSQEKKRDLDKLKMVITQTHLSVNQKFQPTYDIADTLQYYWSSNHSDVLALEEMDRRFFVHEVTVKPLPREFYAEYDKWIRSPEGAAALFDHLLHIDVSDFDPNAPAYITESKLNMARLARSDIDDWIVLMLENPDEFLKINDVPIKGDILSLEEIRAAYETLNQGRAELSQIGLSRKMANHGVRLIAEGNLVYVPHTKLARYYIVRNRERWEKTPLDTIKRYLGGIATDRKMKGL